MNTQKSVIKKLECVVAFVLLLFIEMNEYNSGLKNGNLSQFFSPLHISSLPFAFISFAGGWDGMGMGEKRGGYSI